MTGLAQAPDPRRRALWLRLLGRFILWAAWGGAVGWALVALGMDSPAPEALVAAFVLLGGVFFRICRSPRHGALAVLGLVGVVAVWWTWLPARNDRDWLPEVARLATAEFQGDRVTVHNVRNFDYRSESDFTPRWETRRYDLTQVTGCDLFISYWGPKHIAHTITSWEFADGQHLAVSIETRKEQGETYSALRGFFRQFELYYVVADERDVIGVRTNHRGEQVYRYRLKIPAVAARALLVDYLRQINRLATKPQWYNALTDNCTTTIRYHLKHVVPVQQFSWKMLVNGHLDELLYDRGRIDTSLPFAEIRQRSDITARAKTAASHPEFSRLIR